MSVLKDRRHVSDLACEIERLAAQGELWPGFDPLAIPLVFYDGDDTYLFRCSEVPEGFREIRIGECDVLVYDGRYPAVIASSVVEIEGTPTASVMFDGSGKSSADGSGFGSNSRGVPCLSTSLSSHLAGKRSCALSLSGG